MESTLSLVKPTVVKGVRESLESQPRGSSPFLCPQPVSLPLLRGAYDKMTVIGFINMGFSYLLRGIWHTCLPITESCWVFLEHTLCTLANCTLTWSSPLHCVTESNPDTQSLSFLTALQLGTVYRASSLNRTHRHRQSQSLQGLKMLLAGCYCVPHRLCKEVEGGKDRKLVFLTRMASAIFFRPLSLYITNVKLSITGWKFNSWKPNKHL